MKNQVFSISTPSITRKILRISERSIPGEILQALQIFYKSVKERKIKEILEEIKNGGQNEKYKGIQA